MAVHSKLLALITSSGLQETALLLRPQPTQFFFKYANLCTCTFLLPFECFYMFQYFPGTLVHMAGKARVSRVEKKREADKSVSDPLYPQQHLITKNSA